MHLFDAWTWRKFYTGWPKLQVAFFLDILAIKNAKKISTVSKSKFSSLCKNIIIFFGIISKYSVKSRKIITKIIMVSSLIFGEMSFYESWLCGLKIETKKMRHTQVFWPPCFNRSTYYAILKEPVGNHEKIKDVSRYKHPKYCWAIKTSQNLEFWPTQWNTTRVKSTITTSGGTT